MNYKNSKTIEYLFPVCYLINRNASRIYLIGLKGKKLSTPYELEGIKNVETGRKLEVDRNKYIDLIQEAWDVDIQERTEVKVLVRENSYMDDVDEVRKILKENLREEKVEQGWIYTGKIRGINDFKTWIREHMVTCIVIEPKYIKEEIRHSLVLRKQMYQEMVENGI